MTFHVGGEYKSQKTKLLVDFGSKLRSKPKQKQAIKHDGRFV